MQRSADQKRGRDAAKKVGAIHTAPTGKKSLTNVRGFFAVCGIEGDSEMLQDAAKRPTRSAAGKPRKKSARSTPLPPQKVSDESQALFAVCESEGDSEMLQEAAKRRPAVLIIQFKGNFRRFPVIYYTIPDRQGVMI